MSSTLAVSLPLHGGETGEQGEEVTREKMVELGVGSTREAKGAVESNFGDAASGGEVDAVFATKGPY